MASIHSATAHYPPASGQILPQAFTTVAGANPIAPNSPNLNAYAERWVRTVKREVVRHGWFLSYRGLYETLQEYVGHYNAERPHQSMGNRPLSEKLQVDPPWQKVVTTGKVRCLTRCQGAVRHYYRDAV